MLWSKIDTSLWPICFLILAESPQVSELKENWALREQLSPGHMDHDRPPIKHISLTDRVGVTQGSNAFSGRGQPLEHYSDF